MVRLTTLLSVIFVAAMMHAQTTRVSGRVVDPSGAAIANAKLELRCGSRTQSALSSATGEFFFDPTATSDCKLWTSAAGFASQLTTIGESKIVRLVPATSQQEISVTASRSDIQTTDLPVAGQARSAEQLKQEPALTVDDKLRQIPGFALFRRSGSQTANPTSQGVSLRGLGASGASRSLVLSDGIPMNDPFGGWVYWGRVPLASIAQIEVVEGGVSDLYGSNALGGVINLRIRDRLQTAFSGEASYGSLETPLGSFLASAARGKWGATFAGESFATDGYIPVRSDRRGPVDAHANSKHQTGNLLLERKSDHVRAFLGGNLYGESRRNGTQLQMNQATVRQLQTGLDWQTDAVGSVTLRLYGGTENLHQTFSSINPTRTIETLTVDQRVPASQYGASAQWSKPFAHQLITAGVDFRDVTGDTNESQYALGKYSALLISGGRQQTVGVFGEDVWQITPRWLLSASVRVDHCDNVDASSRRFPAAGGETVTPYTDRAETSLSPRVGFTRIMTNRVSLYGSAYRSFRAPTLNELYRSFRVGNVVTQANAFLQAEHFTGGEGGVRLQANRHVQVRGAIYGGFLDDPVGNITVSSTPTLITRRRQNIGSIRVRGVELASDSRITKLLSLYAAYQLTDATVHDNASDPTLVGKMTPLVPRQAVTFAGTYANPRVLTLSIQGRSNSTEYDDDQNTLPLDPYFNLGVYVERKLMPEVQVFAASENLLNSRYTIGRTPVPTTAAPRTVRIGVRLEVGPRPK